MSLRLRPSPRGLRGPRRAPSLQQGCSVDAVHRSAATPALPPSRLQRSLGSSSSSTSSSTAAAAAAAAATTTTSTTKPKTPPRPPPPPSRPQRLPASSFSSSSSSSSSSLSSTTAAAVAAAASTTTPSSTSTNPPPPSAPPADFDLRDSLIPKTRAIVSERWPELLDLVDDGTLVALPRPEGYVERRTDGYEEPELVLLVAAAHVSRASASAARRVVGGVRPDAVVLELCGSRKGVLLAEEGEEGEGEGLGGAGEGEGGREGDDGGALSSSSSSSLPLSAGKRRNNKASNPFSLSGSLARSASLGGAPAMALRLLLARQSDAVLEAALESERRSGSGSGGDDEASSSSSSSSSSLSSSAFSRRPGVEARAAAAAARQVGATIVLGDRPIEITLRRAWEGLSWPERLKLGRMLLFGEGGGGGGGNGTGGVGLGGGGGGGQSEAAAAAGGGGDGSADESPTTTSIPTASGTSSTATSSPSPSLQQIDALSRDPTSLAAVVASLDAELPALSRALVHERDEWLSWSLARSRAVCGARTVVGVLGAGHVRGVAWRLAQGDRCRPRFAELAGVGGSGIGGEGGGGGGEKNKKKRLSRKERAVRRLAVEVGIAVALGVAWEAWKRV